jgi:acyl carrier protein
MVENQIREYISQELASDRIDGQMTDDYPLLERQVLDSMGMFQLVAYLESEFGVEIEDEELVPTNFSTINDIARLVESKRS